MPDGPTNLSLFIFQTGEIVYCLPRHLYITSKYLKVPLHGSPKTAFDATMKQVWLPLQRCWTTARDFSDLQDWVLIGPSGQIESVRRPYNAERIDIVWPFSHFRCISLFSQTRRLIPESAMKQNNRAQNVSITFSGLVYNLKVVENAYFLVLCYMSKTIALGLRLIIYIYIYWGQLRNTVHTL